MVRIRSPVPSKVLEEYDFKGFFLMSRRRLSILFPSRNEIHARRFRQWKRRQAVATTPEDERKAKAYVDRWQKKLRELTGETGLPRQYRREGGRVRLSEVAKRLPNIQLHKRRKHAILNVSTGGRRNEMPLTEAQKAECLKIAMEYGMPSDRIVFSDNMFTGYMPTGDRLYIGTDVYPCGNTEKADYTISHRGTLAHELIGHRNAYLLGKSQTREYLEEAQASLRASRLASGLSDEERKILMQNAIERLPDGTTLEEVIGLLFYEE